MKSKIKLSPRTKVRLKPEEIQALKSYLENDVAAFTNISINTGIARTTVLRILQKGWLELATAVKLRDFIKEIESHEHL
ncbi:MAG: hypothetical protein JSS64_03550 [Bacteroidetes bacterium]|nr:hypothetical protein [Bacteroidota bacterium]